MRTRTCTAGMLLVVSTTCAAAGAPEEAREMRFPADAGYFDVTRPPYNVVNDGKTDCTATLEKTIQEKKKVCLPNGTYLVSDVLPGGKVRVFSENPETARLVLRWNGNRPHFLRDDNKADKDKLDAWGKVNKKIDVAFLGDVQFNGVVFDDLHKGGVKLADPAIRKGWKNVFFGNGNAAPGEELFTKLTGRIDEQLGAWSGK